MSKAVALLVLTFIGVTLGYTKCPTKGTKIVYPPKCPRSNDPVNYQYCCTRKDSFGGIVGGCCPTKCTNGTSHYFCPLPGQSKDNTVCYSSTNNGKKTYSCTSLHLVTWAIYVIVAAAVLVLGTCICCICCCCSCCCLAQRRQARGGYVIVN